MENAFWKQMHLQNAPKAGEAPSSRIISPRTGGRVGKRIFDRTLKNGCKRCSWVDIAVVGVVSNPRNDKGGGGKSKSHANTATVSLSCPQSCPLSTGHLEWTDI